MSAPHATPGPWKVYRAPNGKLLGIGDAEAAGVTDCVGGLWRSGKEMDANANLIAAAPEMFEALDGLVRYAEAVRMTAGMGKTQMARLEAGKAALAKARGNQPLINEKEA